MFAPAIGILEDPVTGNANGPLGAYLVHHKLVTLEDLFSFRAGQGLAMGREGIIEVSVKLDEQNKMIIKITGEAVIVFDTEIEI